MEFCSENPHQAASAACRSFKLAYGQGWPRIVPARRKCLCLYFFLDRQFGLMHVRLATGFPFPVQVCQTWIRNQAIMAEVAGQEEIPLVNPQYSAPEVGGGIRRTRAAVSSRRLTALRTTRLGG